MNNAISFEKFYLNCIFIAHSIQLSRIQMAAGIHSLCVMLFSLSQHIYTKKKKRVRWEMLALNTLSCEQKVNKMTQVLTQTKIQKKSDNKIGMFYL